MTLQTNLELLAEVGLALILVEVVVVVAQSVAEEGEVGELLLHTQMVLTTRKTSLNRLLLSNRAHWIHLVMRLHGILSQQRSLPIQQKLLKKVGALLQLELSLRLLLQRPR